ncbi:MAG: transporter ATP-binding protein [Deltaproteobacteria bacterium]|jgi:lipoprotein-releasing system ATP-binding protein|nr:transporter ATP-binding protein [Deltaproteobacteria bacterium]
MTEPLIQAVKLCKRYGDGQPIDVLVDLDLQVEAGETVAIVGQSGAGKSTLLHMLGTLDQPTSGKVIFDGVDIFGLREHEQATLRNREVGFIFQFHHLLPDFTALENVMMPALIRGIGRGEAEPHARAVLDRVGLRARLTHKPGELSGGEQQRVAVARAVALSPRVVLADEPTGNLDPVTGAEVQRLLMELNREHHITLVIVTHNETFAASAHRILRLENGQLH